ncbi:Disease resistance response protein 206 [Glycine soja]
MKREEGRDVDFQGLEKDEGRERLGNSPNGFQSWPGCLLHALDIYDTKNIFTAWLGFTFVLNSTYHHGTITFAGADPTLKKTRDVSVIGGTGDFFMHRGIATIMTDAFEDMLICEFLLELFDLPILVSTPTLFLLHASSRSHVL